jgi:hypothetical protein
VDKAQLTILWFVDEKYKKVYNQNKSPITHAIFLYQELWGPEDKLQARTLRSIISRLSKEKKHYKIITSDFEEKNKTYMPLWVQILLRKPLDDESSACKIRYLELWELLIENVPDLLETPCGRARDVADQLVLFDDVADKRDELLRMIEPALKKQESTCTLM